MTHLTLTNSLVMAHVNKIWLVGYVVETELSVTGRRLYTVIWLWDTRKKSKLYRQRTTGVPETELEKVADLTDLGLMIADDEKWGLKVV